MFNQINYNPDVLSCLANLSSDEVFTPPQLANAMLDLLPADIWRDPTAKFLDPAAKSGVFLREIARRLMAGLAEAIPDAQTRRDHIFGKQVYGLAITELTGLLARRSLYCSKTADGRYSVAGGFRNEQGNILYERVEHEWKNGRCVHCGASEGEYGRGAALETHAYSFIHMTNPEEVLGMKFDVIVGNPPYQLDTGGSGRQAKPIYNLFVLQAMKLRPRYLTMIIPSRWFAGGMGLDSFRATMLNDEKLRVVVDYLDARDCFPGVDIAGGVCYFLWERDANGECTVINRLGQKEYKSIRFLNEFDTFIRLGPAVPILRKVIAKKELPLSDIVSGVRPFGLQTKDRPNGKGNIRLVSSGGTGMITQDRVTSGDHMIFKWKVMTSKTSHDHAGQPDKDGMRRVLSRVELLEPGAVCTESYIVLGPFDEQLVAQSCMDYLKTRFVRFLVSLRSFSQDITRDRFSYVPLQDFTEPWTDEKLYAKYGLTEEEIAFIESMVRPMEPNGD